jgi:hypothetical protein
MFKYLSHRPRTTHRSFKSAFIDLNNSFLQYSTPKFNGYNSAPKANNRSMSHTNSEFPKEINRPYTSCANRKQLNANANAKRQRKGSLGTELKGSQMSSSGKTNIYNVKFNIGDPRKIKQRSIGRQKYRSFVKFSENTDARSSKAYSVIRVIPTSIKEYISYNGDIIYTKGLG